MSFTQSTWCLGGRRRVASACSRLASRTAALVVLGSAWNLFAQEASSFEYEYLLARAQAADIGPAPDLIRTVPAPKVDALL